MAKKKITKKKVLSFLLIVFVLIQFIRIDKTNPESEAEHDLMNVSQVPIEIATIMKSACYDCHSNTSKFPWYSNVAPISWWMKGHINHAREKLNFSEWGKMSERERQHNLDECIDMINKEWMPIGTYKVMHKDARITREQRDMIIQWMETQLN